MHAARWRSLGMVVALAVLAPAAAQALPQNVPSARLTGPDTDAVFHVTAFYAKGNQVWATGLVEGTVNGQHVATIARAPVEGTGGGGAGGGGGGGPRGADAGARGISTQQIEACDILHLNLGPLHLDLLGLVVDLDTVVLDIVAQPGAGNLLGNLLCAITGLFDGVSTAALAEQLSALLNSVLGLLG